MKIIDKRQTQKNKNQKQTKKTKKKKQQISLNPLFVSAFVWIDIDLWKTFSIEEISGTLLAMAFAN